MKYACKWALLLSVLLPLHQVAGVQSIVSKKKSYAIGHKRQAEKTRGTTAKQAATRALNVDRTYRAYNSDLTCEVGLSRQNDKLKFFPFEFYYATEADTAEMTFLRDLETNLFRAVSSHVFWCYGKSTTNFDGRRLSHKEVQQRELEIKLARRLGVISVSSGGFDAATECEYFCFVQWSPRCLLHIYVRTNLVHVCTDLHIALLVGMNACLQPLAPLSRNSNTVPSLGGR